MMTEWKASHIVGEPGFGYSIRWRLANEAWADFEVIEEVGVMGANGLADDGKVMYPKAGSRGADHTTEMTEAEVCFRGSVKWDGCSSVATRSDCELHLCGGDHWAMFGEVIAKIPAMALEMLGRKSFG